MEKVVRGWVERGMVVRSLFVSERRAEMVVGERKEGRRR